MIENIGWSLPLTLVVFFAARRLGGWLKTPLLNPLLVSMAVIIPLLVFSGISYERYFSGSKALNDLLQPAVVALCLSAYTNSFTRFAHAGNPSLSFALSVAFWRC
jgi:putative effector of murein hydrolase